MSRLTLPAKNKPVCVGEYFTRFGRLYYVLDYYVGADDEQNMYLIENCATLITFLVDSEFVRKEVEWVARNISS